MQGVVFFVLNRKNSKIFYVLKEILEEEDFSLSGLSRASSLVCEKMSKMRSWSLGIGAKVWEFFR